MSGIVLVSDDSAHAADSQISQASSSGRATALSYETLLVTRINGTLSAHPSRLMLASDGQLLASAEDFSRWRIRLPAVAPVSAKGKQYFPLSAVEGLKYEIDEGAQVLAIDGRPDIFVPTVINAKGAEFSLPEAAPAGSFLNYDFQLERQNDANRLGGLLELGLFNRLGFGTGTFLAQTLDGPDRFVRLETAWSRDDPESMRSLRVGDSVGRAGAWGRSIRYGGLKWGTDFATRPDFVPFSLPTVTGEAVLPSTVDLYVNNALRASQKVPYGAFEIPNVPVITGEGEVKVVVRDILGRESVVTQPYHVSPGLLRDGVHDYSYEMGFTREDFAVESNRYGRLVGVATHRAGLSDRMTGEARGELLSDQQTAGVSGSYLWPAIGVLNASTALSHRDSGPGGLLSLGIDRQARTFGFGVQTELATPDFVQLGLLSRQAPRQVSVVRASVSPGEIGSFFVSYVHQDHRSQSDAELVSAGYSVNIFDHYYLSVSALKSLTGEQGTSFGISLTRSLGPRTTASVNFSSENDDTRPGFQIQQNLPRGEGFGYRVSGVGGDIGHGEASLFLQEDVGTYSVQVARQEEANAYRASASGGVALLAGDIHMSRRLDDSFAVARVGEYSGVEVYLDNQPITHTDSTGFALLPHLRPYERNSISIREEDLPLDAQISSSRLDAVPARRSGAVVEFPVRPSRGALIRLVLQNGSPMPAGAVVNILGQKEEFPVALRGEVFVTGLSAGTDLQASWRGQTCKIHVVLPSNPGSLPVLGPFVCDGMEP